jgi:pimeloyl-ACP methyl ester carboxylesterase
MEIDHLTATYRLIVPDLRGHGPVDQHERKELAITGSMPLPAQATKPAPSAESEATGLLYGWGQ